VWKSDWVPVCPRRSGAEEAGANDVRIGTRSEATSDVRSVIDIERNYHYYIASNLSLRSNPPAGGSNSHLDKLGVFPFL
jgi:hypothetical protein